MSAHATATPFNDAAETRGTALALGEREASEVAVHAFKAQVGHTLGAAGAIESLVCLDAIERGVLPATAGGGEMDPDAPARVLSVGEAGGRRASRSSWPRRLAGRTPPSSSSTTTPRCRAPSRVRARGVGSRERRTSRRSPTSAALAAPHRRRSPTSSRAPTPTSSGRSPPSPRSTARIGGRDALEGRRRRRRDRGGDARDERALRGASPRPRAALRRGAPLSVHLAERRGWRVRSRLRPARPRVLRRRRTPRRGRGARRRVAARAGGRRRANGRGGGGRRRGRRRSRVERGGRRGARGGRDRAPRHG